MRVLFDNGTPRGIAVLGKGRWRLIRSRLAAIAAAVDAATPGIFVEVDIPNE